VVAAFTVFVCVESWAGSPITFNSILFWLIVGITYGSVYAVAATGLVVTYTTSGIFNFAHGAIGMLGAFTYWQLKVNWHWSTPAALALVLLVLAPLFGVFLEVVVMRGLQGTAEVTKIVVSIGLLAAMIGLANWIWQPTISRTLAPFFVADPQAGETQPYHVYVRRDEPVIVFGSVDSGVANKTRDDGVSFLDAVWAGAPFADHGRFMQAVERAAADWRTSGQLTQAEQSAVVQAARRAERELT